MPHAEHNAAEEDKFELLDPNQHHNPPNEVLSEPQDALAKTCVLTFLLQECHTINFVEADFRLQLSRICVHLYRDGLNLETLPQC